MEKYMFLCLTMGTFVLRANTQTQYPNVINPGNIYFDDRSDAAKVIHALTTPNSIHLQQPFNSPSGAKVPTNGQNVGNFLINGANVHVPTVGNPNVEQRQQNNLNIVPQPVYYDPNEVNRQSDEDDAEERNKILFEPAVVALTNFSLNVMKTVAGLKRGNTVVSPYSIASLLALLQQGATEQTLEQISMALQMSPQVSAAAYRTQNQDIQNRNSRNILTTANNIFLADAFNLNPVFRAVAQKDFHSDITPTVFQRPEQAAQLINSWVASKTNNKIDKLVTPESVSANTQLVLVNAIYFKGIWEIPFRTTSTKLDEFRYRDGTVKNIPFMNTKHYFKGGRDKYSDTEVVVLPFEREEYSLMIMLPSELSNADDLIKSLTVQQLENYQNLNSLEVVLKIPKFTIRADTDLTPVLKQMGVSKIFNQNSGLSGLGMFRDFTPQVSSAVHSASLTIDEEGGSAAAASAFAAVALSNVKPYLFMKIDRPFVAVLWDGKTKIPLFMAKIEDPRL